MMHTLLKVLKCRWLVSQNITYFSTCKKPINFWKFKQSCRCQKWTKLSIFRKFLSSLCLARLFYIKYIRKLFAWSKNEQIGITFLQVGKLRLHKLCQNKHFSTAGTISPNSKRKTFSCSPSVILFNHKLGLFK